MENAAVLMLDVSATSSTDESDFPIPGDDVMVVLLTRTESLVEAKLTDLIEEDIQCIVDEGWPEADARAAAVETLRRAASKIEGPGVLAAKQRSFIEGICEVFCRDQMLTAKQAKQLTILVDKLNRSVGVASEEMLRVMMDAPSSE
jgi:uncharacterized coiled-coil protein SlyX